MCLVLMCVVFVCALFVCVVFVCAAFISVEGGTLKLRENFCAGSFERLRSDQVSLYRRLAVLFSTCFSARFRRNIWSPHASQLPTSKNSCAVSSQTPVHTVVEILGRLLRLCTPRAVLGCRRLAERFRHFLSRSNSRLKLAEKVIMSLWMVNGTGLCFLHLIQAGSELALERENGGWGRGKRVGSLCGCMGKTPVTTSSNASSGSVPICIGGSDQEPKHSSSAGCSAVNATTSQWTKGGALGVSRAHPCVVPVSGTAFVVVGGCKSAQHVEDSMVATAEYLFP